MHGSDGGQHREVVPQKQQPVGGEHRDEVGGLTLSATQHVGLERDLPERWDALGGGGSPVRRGKTSPPRIHSTAQ